MAKDKPIEIPVSFKNVTFGDKLVSIGFATSRTKSFPPNKADSILTGKRLTLKIFVGAPAADGQTRAFADGDMELAGVFDTSNLSVSSKRYSGTLSAPIESIDDSMIRQFAKRNGRIEITSVEKADNEDAGDE